MTICNMSIEMGARGGIIAPDETTYAYMKGRPFAPQGENWEKKLTEWKQLYSDADAKFDLEINIDAAAIEPMITYGTNPGMGVSVRATVPTLETMSGATEKQNFQKALAYMGLTPGQSLLGMPVHYVFIGSCTNSRIEDLRAAAAVVRGKHRASNVSLAMVVPGSGLVKEQAEREGLDKIFRDAGFEWREPGCSMCLAMNADRLEPGERCASTSNRNFEGRQGAGGRTHLVSPAMAAAAGVAGHFVDVSAL